MTQTYEATLYSEDGEKVHVKWTGDPVPEDVVKLQLTLDGKTYEADADEIAGYPV